MIPETQKAAGTYEQSETIRNQLKLSEEMLRPSMMLRPHISRDPTDGIWDAYYDGVIIATGKTPAEAFENFDKAWIGEE